MLICLPILGLMILQEYNHNEDLRIILMFIYSHLIDQEKMFFYWCACTEETAEWTVVCIHSPSFEFCEPIFIDYSSCLQKYSVHSNFLLANFSYLSFICDQFWLTQGNKCKHLLPLIQLCRIFFRLSQIYNPVSIFNNIFFGIFTNIFLLTKYWKMYNYFKYE